MPKDLKESLGAFMIKQMNEKPTKQEGDDNFIFTQDKENKQDKTEEKPKTEEEIKEEEELEEAKKTSRAKAADYDQSGMVKKVLLEAIVKYGAMALFIVILIIAVINLGPMIGKLLHGLIFKTVIGAMKQ